MKKVLSVLMAVFLLSSVLAGASVMATGSSTVVQPNGYYSQQVLTKFSEGQSASLTISVDQLGNDWYASGLSIVVNTALESSLPAQVWQTTGADGVFTYSFQANSSNQMVGMIYRSGEGTGSTAAADWAVASLTGDVTIEIKQNGSGVTALYLNGSEWVPHSSSGLSIPDGYLALATSPGSSVTVKASQAAVGAPAKVLDGLEVKETPTKLTYTKGEALDLTGLKVDAVYTDTSKNEVTGYTTSPANGAVLDTVGQQTVTVSYTEGGITKTAAFEVVVEQAGVFGYYSQQEITKFSEGQSATVTISVNRLGNDWFSAGLTLVITPNLSDTFPVDVWQTTGADGVFTFSFQANSSNQMVGMIYRSGEGTGSTAAADWAVASLDGDVTIEVKQNGSGVTALYLNGNEWVPHSSSGLSIPDGYLAIATTPGSEIVVNASQAAVGGQVKALDGLQIKENPTKLTYTKGETLDLTGLKVEAVYTDTSRNEVTDYTASPANGAVLDTVGQQTVTVSYTEGDITKEAAFDVTVSDVVVPGPGTNIPDTGEHGVTGMFAVLTAVSLLGIVLTSVSKKVHVSKVG